MCEYELTGSDAELLCKSARFGSKGLKLRSFSGMAMTRRQQRESTCTMPCSCGETLSKNR